MSLIGELYNFWAGALIYTFQGMMYDQRYRHWLKYFQLPMGRTPEEVKLVGYSKQQLSGFWQLSSKLQSVVLKSAVFQTSFTMSLSATSYVIEMYRRYNGLYTPLLFWFVVLVSYSLVG